MSPIDEIEEQLLLQSLSKGDSIAFERIYREYASLLFRFARKNIDSDADCEEIVHDIFESLWMRRQELRITSLRHYLLTSVRYKIIRYFKQQTVRKKYAAHYSWFEVVYENTEAEAIDPDTLHALVIDKIADLPERCQAVIRLRVTEHLSHNQIAERLNITRKTVEMHLLRAYNHLRAEYNKVLERGLG